MRCAKVTSDTVSLYSVAISAKEGAEMQITQCTLTPDGMKVEFLRMQDDENVVVRVGGDLFRTD